jgi:hypothetical protein
MKNLIIQKIDGHEYEFKSVEDVQKLLEKIKARLSEVKKEQQHLCKVIKYFDKFLGNKKTDKGKTVESVN